MWPMKWIEFLTGRNRNPLLFCVCVFQTQAWLFPALLPRRASKCEDVVHGGARSRLWGTQELPQQPFLLWVPVIIPSRSLQHEISHSPSESHKSDLVALSSGSLAENVRCAAVLCTKCRLRVLMWCFCRCWMCVWVSIKHPEAAHQHLCMLFTRCADDCGLHAFCFSFVWLSALFSCVGQCGTVDSFFFFALQAVFTSAAC